MNQPLFADQLKSRSDELEVPTWTVLILTYGAWMGLTFYATQIPMVLLMVLGGYVVCLHGSLQHEAVHGHPTRSQFLNTALIWWPLSLWMPYVRYRDLHQAHHNCETLTEPGADTESYYFRREHWRHIPRWLQTVLRLNQTLLGRLTVGPFIAIARYWPNEWKLILDGDLRVLRIWLIHFAGVAVVLFWVLNICGMSLVVYICTFALPGLSLTLLRSYTEHRPGPSNPERTAIVEGSPLTRLLFLNNNYHVIHHDRPGMPWFKIKGVFEAHRSSWLKRNNGFYFKSYGDLLRKFAVTPKDHPVV